MHGAELALGLAGTVYVLRDWSHRGFHDLDVVPTLRIIIPSVLAIALGVHVIFSSFFLSLLRLKRLPEAPRATHESD